MRDIHVSWSTWIILVLLTVQFIVTRLIGDGGDIYGVSAQVREALSWIAFLISGALTQLKPVGASKPESPN